jgi:hypothetical protein
MLEIYSRVEHWSGKRKAKAERITPTSASHFPLSAFRFPLFRGDREGEMETWDAFR